MKDLISRLKQKDENALNEVMRMYKKDIFRYLLCLTANREVAEELTQDTFVKVYFKASGLKSENLKGWIFKIALNTARSYFRKEKTKNLFLLKSFSQLNEQQLACNPQTGDFLLLEKVKQLVPEKYLTPFLLKELQDFSYEEIASFTKKPVGTVKSLIFRAKELLRENLSLSPGELK